MSKEDVVVEHKSPKCGKPMLAGKLTGDAAFSGQATLKWIGNKKIGVAQNIWISFTTQKA